MASSLATVGVRFRAWVISSISWGPFLVFR